MEPLVSTILCPSCGECHVHFEHTAVSHCDGCGFEIAVYNDKVLAARHFAGYRRDRDVIVADPVRLGSSRWLIAHTRLLLV